MASWWCSFPFTTVSVNPTTTHRYSLSSHTPQFHISSFPPSTSPRFSTTPSSLRFRVPCSNKTAAKTGKSVPGGSEVELPNSPAAPSAVDCLGTGQDAECLLKSFLVVEQVEIEYVPEKADLDEGMDEEFRKIFEKFSFSDVTGSEDTDKKDESAENAAANKKAVSPALEMEIKSEQTAGILLKPKEEVGVKSEGAASILLKPKQDVVAKSAAQIVHEQHGNKWFSESGKLVAKLFQKIQEMVEEESNLVFVFIDEVESLAVARKDSLFGSEPSDSIRNLLDKKFHLY